MLSPMHAPTQLSPDQADCLAILRQGSRSFYAASYLLPWRVRGPAAAVYAFCREADDAVDKAHGNPHVITALHRRLDGIYQAPHPSDPADTSTHRVDRALRQVVWQFHIPRALFAALLEGFAWDAQGQSYTTLGQLRSYAARVAGSVGAIMALLMGARQPAVLACACDLGVAMQLTNIARDIGEDARLGRLYLPQAWLLGAGLQPQQLLQAPAFDPKLGGVVRQLLDEAQKLYAQAEAGIAYLPADCRMAIYAARLIYAAIGHKVRLAGYNSMERRAVVSTPHKLCLLAWSLSARFFVRRRLPPWGLEETAFLVQAAAAGQPR